MHMVRILFSGLIAGLTAIILIGCNSSSDSPSDPVILKGTAAVGAPIVGHIEVRGTDGGTLANVTIDAEGTFEAIVTALTAPYILAAIPQDSDQQTQYSFATSAGNVNITPLTTWALLLAHENKPLDQLFKNWSPASAPTAERVSDAGDHIKQNYIDRFNAASLPDFDIFTTPFAANREGFDAILDALQIVFNWEDGSVTVNGSVVKIELDPDVLDPPVSGNFLLRLTTTVQGVGNTIDIPDMPKPDSEAEFCSVESYKVFQEGAAGTWEINSCSFDGTIGNIDATLSTNAGGFPMTLSYSVRYEYIAQ